MRDAYESDREENAVARYDEDFGQREAYNWEWEPDAIDRKNRLMRQQKEAIATYYAMNGKPVVSPQMLKTVGLALLVIFAITFLLLLVPVGGCQELTHLPAFEKQFVWAQMTWSKSENQWCIDAQPMGAGPGELVGACAETLQDAKRAVMSDSAEALPIMEQPNGQTDSRTEDDLSHDVPVLALPDTPEPKPAVISPHGALEPSTRPYWDRTNVILASSMVAVGSFDLAQTCHSIANGGREVWMPMKTCGSLVGIGIAMGIGMTYLSYELHRHGHRRLERIPFIGMIAGNSAGIAFSKRNGAW